MITNITSKRQLWTGDMETLHLDSDANQIFITYFSVYNNIVCKYETITIYDDDLYYIT